MYPKDYNPDSFVSVPGERFKTEYVGEPDEFGVIMLIPVGETDLVELHQRDAEANDVNVLYQRFCNGDVTAFSQRQGTYMDALGFPRDLRGMYNMVADFRKTYDNLPAEKKKLYTFEQFIENAGSEQWIKDFVAAAAPAAAESAPAAAESAPAAAESAPATSSAKNG